MNIIAVGPREQDFEYTNGFFSGSITLYGSGTAGNISYCRWKKERINHNVFSQEQEDFVNRELLKKIEQDPEVRFMSYDPNQVYSCNPAIASRTVCLNEKALMDKLNHKISFRKMKAPENRGFQTLSLELPVKIERTPADCSQADRISAISR